MPQFNFEHTTNNTALLMPVDLVDSKGNDNAVQLSFATEEQATKFIAQSRQVVITHVGKTVTVNLRGHPKAAYLRELITYYRDRGKKNKKEVTLACIAIACLNLDLDQVLTDYLPSVKRIEFIKTAYATNGFRHWLKDIITKFNPNLTDKKIAENAAVQNTGVKVAVKGTTHHTPSVPTTAATGTGTAATTAATTSVKPAAPLPATMSALSGLLAAQRAPTAASNVAAGSATLLAAASENPTAPPPAATDPVRPPPAAKDVKTGGGPPLGDLKNDLGIVDTQATLKRANDVLKTYEAVLPQNFPDREKEEDDQKEANTEPLFKDPSSVKVTKEKGKNSKDPTIYPSTEYQDSADAEVLDQPKEKKPADVLEGLKKATIETGDVLKKKHLYSGTTFSACAIGNFAGRLVASCVHLGDSAIVHGKADGSAQVLTPSHNMADNDEITRLKAAGFTKNLIWDGKGYYLVNGYNFHHFSQLPNLLKDYAGDYIFIERDPFTNSSLFFVDPETKQAERITINNYAKFKSALRDARLDPLKWMKKMASQAWEQEAHNINTTLRISGNNLHAVLNHCSPHKNLANIDRTNLHGIGNARYFGNGAIPGDNYVPAVTQLEIGKEDSIIAITDGADNLKLEDLVRFARTSNIRKEAYLRGSKDDITALIATELAKLLPGKILLLIIADGHGAQGHEVSAEAIKIFKLKFCAQLGIKADDVLVKVAAPLPLNSAMFATTAAAASQLPPPSVATAAGVTVHNSTAPTPS